MNRKAQFLLNIFVKPSLFFFLPFFSIEEKVEIKCIEHKIHQINVYNSVDFF